MNKVILATMVGLMCLVIVMPILSGTRPHLALADDGRGFPPVRFDFDSREGYDLVKDSPGFRVEDRFGDWDIRGYFFNWERDSTHIGDIEGAWILRNRITGVVYTAAPAHLTVHLRCEPGAEGRPIVFCTEGNTHGTRYAPGQYDILPLVPYYGANGEGRSFDDRWFEEHTNVYSGEEGAQNLRTQFSGLRGLAHWSRVELITKAMSDRGGIYGSLLDTASAGIEKWSILKWQAADKLGGIDFSSAQLTYISADFDPEAGGQRFKYAIKIAKAEGGAEAIDLERSEKLSLASFLTGLSLPNDKFWVNLNPWEPDRIVDEDLGATDVGRIMLEADLQMKRDFCKHENPCQSEVGESYWDLLDEKQEQLVTECMDNHPGQIEATDNVLFQVATRHWIVPDEITAYGDGDDIYIADATLDIYSEPVYEHSTFEIVNQSKLSISEDCLESLDQAAEEYGRYAMELEEELVLPLVVEEVNSGENYSDLRQVYVSLALAQWYKERVDDQRMFSDLINSRNLTGLESEATWSPRDVWARYVESYEEGEYQCKKETTYTKGGFIITETMIYTGGGVDFDGIASHISIVDTIDPQIEEAITAAPYIPFISRNNEYYFGDCLYAPVPPAEFTITSLDLSNKQVKPGEVVTITAQISNIGGSEGSYVVNLTINGEAEQTKTVTLAPGATEVVAFTTTKGEPGSYNVSIDGKTTEFVVAAPSWLERYWWAILLIAIAAVFLVYFLRRRAVSGSKEASS